MLLNCGYQLDESVVQSATKLAWDMVCSVPPCICSQPETLNFDDEYCQKIKWTEDPNYVPANLQPVLFFEAKIWNVGVKGRVTKKIPSQPKPMSHDE